MGSGVDPRRAATLERTSPTGDLRAQLATLAIEAHGWRNDWTSGAAHADELLASEPEGSRPWCMAAAVKVWSAPLRGQLEGYVETIQRLHGVTAVWTSQ